MKLQKVFSSKRQAIEKSKTQIVGAAAAAAVVVSLSIVGSKFLWDLGQYNVRVINEKETALRQLEDNVESAEQLVASFNSFETLKANGVDSRLVLDALPSRYDFPALVTSLESLAQKNGLTLVGVRGEDLGDNAPGIASDPEPVEMPVAITVEGDYQSVSRFMEAIDRSIRPITIRQVDMRGNDAAIEIVMQIVSYFQPGVSLELESKVVR